MASENMNTKEVAQYLGIHEKQVYALIKAQRIPCTRVTGKWIFPKKLVDDWIESSARGSLEQAREKRARVSGALLASGSNDPILDMLHTYMRKAYPEFYVFSANIGSTDGLHALNRGYTDLAWSHLWDPQSGEYNIPFVSSHLPNIQPVIVNLFYRELGFLLAPGNPLGIRGFQDLKEKNVRFINRQKGAGTRVLLDHHLLKLGIPPSAVKGYDNEVNTHLEVGLAILAKEAEMGFGTVAVSSLLGLSFIPVTQERFDMLLDRETFFEKGVQAMIEVLQSPEFRRRVDRLGSYDFRDAGKILYSSKN